MQNKMAECKSFDPIINKNSKTLILGSMPGIKSLNAQEYYAHPQNRFWKVIGIIFNAKDLDKQNYKNKTEILLKNNIALWDTIKFCTREGSLDSAIENEYPNEIDILLNNYPNIKTICLNGNKAYNSLKKYFPKLFTTEKYTIIKLPSTSPANAKWRIEDLAAEWKLYINKK